MSEKLTCAKAFERICEMQRLSDDNEAAHKIEDALRAEFIEGIANGMYDSDIKEVIAVADVVRKSNLIQFERWYA